MTTNHAYHTPARLSLTSAPPEVIHHWRGDRNRGTMTCARCGCTPGGWRGSMPCGSDPRDPKWGIVKSNRAEAKR